MERILVYGMTDNMGGIESYLMNLYRHLDRDRVQFDFVTDFPTMAYADEVSACGSDIYYIPAKSKGLFSQWKAFARILKKHPEYKKIYFNILDAGAAVTMLIPWLYGRTIVTHSHNDNTEKRRLHKICRPFLNLFTRKRYACSKKAAEFMFGHRSAVVIPNAINAKKYQFDAAVREKKRRELGIEHHFAVCHVGRLAVQKNPKMLIDIFEAVLEKEPSAVLLSVGNGELRDEIHAYVQQKHLENAVLFLGERNDVNEILQAADVFLFPSLYEGLGIALIEAQAAGLHCVVSDVINQEALVTDNISLVSLHAPVSRWAEKVLECKNAFRTSPTKQIIRAGYDNMHPGDAEIALQHYFESAV